MRRVTRTAARLSLCGIGFFAGVQLWSASHSDAPLIKQDPQANITDVYTFVGQKYNNPSEKVLNVVVHVRPFSEPGDGVIYERFADDALYSIHITNPATGAEFLRYNFLFSSVNPLEGPGLKNPNTILSYGLGTEAGPIMTVGDARQNYTQTYTVTRVDSWRRRHELGHRLLTPPPNVGARTTPLYNDPATGRAISGATTPDGLDPYTRQTIYTLHSGEVVFAGPREDGFYADTPGIFDLLDPRIVMPSPPNTFGQQGGGVDGFKGFNVLAYAVQIPVNLLKSVPGFPNVGVYASVSRERVTLRFDDTGRDGKDKFDKHDDRERDDRHENWVQVNRMGNPLFNEVLVALKDKDRYNRTSPTRDANFATYARNPELASLINFVFGLNLQTNNRSDLVSIYIPDVLRVDTSTGPVPLAGQAAFNRLSLFGGDTTPGANGQVPGGWPNGRRFGDDVIDIALTAIASGPAFNPITLVGDNIAANDQVYHQVFPYSATPHAGPRNSKDSGLNVGN